MFVRNEAMPQVNMSFVSAGGTACDLGIRTWRTGRSSKAALREMPHSRPRVPLEQVPDCREAPDGHDTAGVENSINPAT